MNTGERIRQLRKNKGLSLAELGKILGLSYGTIAAIETGKSDPSTEAIVKLSETFNVSTDYILTGKENNLSTEEKEIIETIRNEKEIKSALLEMTNAKKKVISYTKNFRATAMEARA